MTESSEVSSTPSHGIGSFTVWKEEDKIDNLLKIKRAVLILLDKKGYDITEERYILGNVDELTQVMARRFLDTGSLETLYKIVPAIALRVDNMHLLQSYAQKLSEESLDFPSPSGSLTYLERKAFFTGYLDSINANPIRQSGNDTAGIDSRYQNLLGQVATVKYMIVSAMVKQRSTVESLLAHLRSSIPRPRLIVIISDVSLTTDSINLIEEQEDPGILNVLYFTASELIFLTTKSAFAPFHWKMPEKDQALLAKSSGISLSSLPIITSDDPLVRLNDYKKGTVLGFMRHSDSFTSNIDTYVYKRVVK